MRDIARPTLSAGGPARPAGPAVAVRVRITGVVQGVGYRPFVHRLASGLGLAGIVGNDAGSVFVELEGPEPTIGRFLAALRTDGPPLADVQSLDVHRIRLTGRRDFAIVESRPTPGAVTSVAPDTAVCDACLDEMWDPTDRRYLHPFVTCTDCGPRFTITRSLPYDRPGTTMAGFPLCPACRAEYEDPGDRRYHAQPIGCHDCGPSLTFRSGMQQEAGRSAIGAARRLLAGGGVLAVKGLGGYHLVCDACSDAAVGGLRVRKGRPDKPLAVMVADVAAAAALAVVGPAEAELLCAPARPIVLVRRRPDAALSALVAPGTPLVGLLLAYTPLHHLLLSPRTPGPETGAGAGRRDAAPGPLVVTSSNPSGEPICFRDDDLLDRVGHIIDGVLGHDRPIHVPCDDSVVRVSAGRPVPIRRSRGYAPLPVRVPPSDVDVLAVGAESKNTFCVATGDRAWMSQHIGDMGDLETLRVFEASIEQFCALYRIAPALIAADAHPGYTSSRWARSNRPEAVVEVQHHHAHVAAVMAEHGLDPTRRVIGLAFDGTGYGDDGTIWGGEILEADAAGYHRAGHLATVDLPGGDACVRHPWRTALSHLRAAGVAWDPDLPPVRHAGAVGLRVVDRQLSGGLACVPTSSMGRLFDAVSSLLGLHQDVTFEAQAAVALEHAAAGHLAGGTPSLAAARRGGTVPRGNTPSLAFAGDGQGGYDAGPLLAELVAARRAGVTAAAAAAAFHLAVADLAVAAACRSRDRTGSSTAILAGGVWQNTLLSSLAGNGLRAAGFDVLTNAVVPANDGGLALGQLFVARHRATDPDPSTSRKA